MAGKPFLEDEDRTQVGSMLVSITDHIRGSWRLKCRWLISQRGLLMAARAGKIMMFIFVNGGFCLIEYLLHCLNDLGQDDDECDGGRK